MKTNPVAWPVLCRVPEQLVLQGSHEKSKKNTSMWNGPSLDLSFLKRGCATPDSASPECTFKYIFLLSQRGARAHIYHHTPPHTKVWFWGNKEHITHPYLKICTCASRLAKTGVTHTPLKIKEYIATNLSNTGWISVDRSSKATLPLTIPSCNKVVCLGSTPMTIEIAMLGATPFRSCWPTMGFCVHQLWTCMLQHPYAHKLWWEKHPIPCKWTYP